MDVVNIKAFEKIYILENLWFQSDKEGEEVVDIFKKGKFELVALTETKLKGKGEISWSGVKVIFAGVQGLEIDREGVAVLLNDVLHSAIVKYGYVSSRILWLKFMFSRFTFV